MEIEKGRRELWYWKIEWWDYFLLVGWTALSTDESLLIKNIKFQALNGGGWSI